MKKFLLVPDSFKGTLTSKEICEAMRDTIALHYPDASAIHIPVADGGEGSVDCFLSAVGGQLIKCKSVNPYFEEMEGLRFKVGPKSFYQTNSEQAYNLFNIASKSSVCGFTVHSINSFFWFVPLL